MPAPKRKTTKPAAKRKSRSKSKSDPRAGARKTLALVLVIVLVAGVLGSVLLAVPEAMPFLTKLLGVREEAVIPTVDGDATAAVHFIDVGQGDAVLLEESGSYALLDAGPPEGEDALLAYLEGAGVERLEYVIMSHPHADHIGGMQAVLAEYPAGLVLLPDFDKAPYPTTRTFESLLEAMMAQGNTAETMRSGNAYTLGAGSITVLQDGVETPDNYNLLSVSLVFESAGLRFLATGDGEKANENALLASGYPLNANLFKAGHHGSSTSNSPGLLEAVRPEVAVISCAAGNDYGHPHRDTLSTLAAVQATVLRTDKDGSVVVWPGPGGLRWSTAASTLENAA